MSVTSAALQVKHAAADHLTVIAGSATAKSAGTLATPIKVEVRDAFENPINDGDFNGDGVADAAATRTISASATGATLANAGPIDIASDGTATFTALTAAGTAATPYTINLAASGITVTGATHELTLTPGAPAKLALATDVQSTVRSGFAMTTAPKVKILDSADNWITDDSTANVTVALVDTFNTAGTQSAEVSAANGVATFSGLTYSAITGSTYKLQFKLTSIDDGLGGTTSVSSTAIRSSAFSITAGAPTKFEIVNAAASTAQNNAAIRDTAGTGYLKFKITDDAGNQVTTTGDVTVTISASVRTGQGETGVLTSLTGDTKTETNGEVEFTNLKLRGKVGNYVLSYSVSAGSTALAAATGTATTSSLALIAGTAHHLNLTQAAGAVNGANFTTQPVVTVEDIDGNTVTTATGNAEVTVISTNSADVTLSGPSVTVGQTTTNNALALTSGAADFGATGNELKLTGKVGSYTLRFSAAGLTVDQNLTLTVGAPATISMFTSSPQTTVVTAQALADFKLKVFDASNNLYDLASSTSTVTAVLQKRDGSGNWSNHGTTTYSEQAVNGVVTFSNMTFTETPGSNYRIKFTLDSTSDVVTSPLTITAGAPASMHLTWAPGTPSSGQTFASQPVIEVRDAVGNVLPSAGGATITAALVGSPANATLTTGTTSINGSEQMAWSGMSLAAPIGDYKIRFTASTTNSSDPINGTTVDSSLFTLSHGLANKLEITRSIDGSRSGIAAGTQPKITVQDAQGNTVTGLTATAIDATLTDASGNATSAATLTTATSPNTISGVATFTDVTITGTAGTYRLNYKLNGTQISTFETVTLTAGTAVKIAVEQQPDTSVMTNEVFATAPKVRLLDSAGNLVDTDSSSKATVALVLPDATVETASAGVTASNGYVTFAGLKYLKTPATGFKLQFKLVGSNHTDATQQSRAFEITPGAAASIRWASTSSANDGKPRASVQNNTAIKTSAGGALAIEIIDAYGNVVTADDATTVTASVKTAGGAVTSLTNKTATAVSGSVRFSSLTLRAKVANYVLQFTAANAGKAVNATFVLSDSIELTAGVADHIDATTIAEGAKSGQKFTTQPVIKIFDIDGNVVDSTATITASVAPVSPNTETATFTDSQTSMAAVAGVANFDSGVLNANRLGLSAKVGTYRVTYSVGAPLGALGSIYQDIYVAPGAAAKIAIVQQMAANTAIVVGEQLSTMPHLEVRDATDNKVTDDNVSTATVKLYKAGSATSVATSSPVAASNGVIRFTNLSYSEVPAADYSLHFKLVGKTGTDTELDSNVFELTHGAADHLEFVTQPGSAQSGIDLAQQPVLRVVDRFGYPVYGSTATSVSVSLLNAASTDVLVATTKSVNSSTALVTFNDINISAKKGTYKLRFTATNATTGIAINNTYVDSADITLTHGAAHHIGLTTEATGARAGLEFDTQPVVTIYDSQNNVIETGSDATAGVTVELTGANAASAALLTGRTGTAASAGVARFADQLNGENKKLGLTGTAGTYTLKYTVTGLAPVTQTIDLKAGLAYKLGNHQAPTTVAVDTVFDLAPSVKVYDEWNNFVDVGSSSTASVALVSTTGSVRAAAATATALAGVLKFENLKFTSAPANGYKLLFTLTSGANANNASAKVESAAFRITPGEAASMQWVTEPSGARSGLVMTGQPVIQIVDKFGYPVADGNTTLAATLTSPLNGLSLTSTATASSATDGRVTFTNLKLTGPASASGYGITFTATNIGAAIDNTTLTTTADVPLSHGIAARLALTSAAESARAGLEFGTQPKLTVVDAQGNRVTDNFTYAGIRHNDAALSIAAAVGNNDPISWLTGTVASPVKSISLAATTGQADFANFGSGATLDAGLLGTANASGTSYTITYSTTTDDSTALTVDQTIVLTAGNPATVDVKSGADPQSTIKTGDVFSPAPAVEVFDAFGNKVLTDSSSQVSVSLVSTTNGGNPTYTYANNFTASAGVVTASGMSFTALPGTYKMKFTLAGGGSVTNSTVITVTHADPAAIELVAATWPTSANSESAMSPAPQFKVVDRFGNQATADSSTVVTASLSTGTATVTGASATAANGIATFNALKLSGVPGTYRLQFAATWNGATLTGAHPASFELLPGAPDHLDVTVAADQARSRMALGTLPVIKIMDGANNVVTTSSGQITVELRTQDGTALATAATLSGDVTRDAVNGVVSFSVRDALAQSDDPLVISGAAGFYTLRYTLAAGLNYGQKTFDQTIELTAGLPAALAVATQPVSGKTGDLLVTQPAIQLRDADGNPVLSDNSTDVVASVEGVAVGQTAARTDGEMLTSTYSVRTSAPTKTAVNGVARFTDLQVKGFPGAAYRLKFTVAGISAPVYSQAITFTANDPAALSYLRQPVGGINGELLATSPQLELTDRFGYRLDDSTYYVEAELDPSSGANGSISGVIRKQITNGVVDFDGLKLTGKTAEDYFLVFKVGTTITSPISGHATSTVVPLKVSPAVASTLTIVTPASGARADAPFDQAPVLEITDFMGNLVTNQSASIVTTATSANGGSTFGIGASTSTTSGSKTITDLGIHGLIGSYTVTYTATITKSITDSESIAKSSTNGEPGTTADNCTITCNPRIATTH